MAVKSLQGSEKVMQALEEIAKKMGGGGVSIGFMGGATYPDGTPVAAVAFWNEFGDPANNRPPRPFFREMIEAESPAWPKTMARLAKATDYDGEKVLGLMGEDIGGGLQQSINEFTTPELAESTKKAKGFDKPLIDTHDMIRAVSYQVNNGAIIPVDDGA